MPVAAAGLADVGAADRAARGSSAGAASSAVRSSRLAVSTAARSASACARVADAGRERVAELLELTEVEHPRRPGGADPVRDLDPAQPLGDEARQLQLELADLAAQLGAGEPLVDLQRLSTACLPRADPA